MTKDEAIQHFGSSSNLARALGITKQAVNSWDEIPLTRQYQVEVVSNGLLKADDARRRLKRKTFRDPEISLEKALAFFNGQSGLAKALCLSRSSVSLWKKSGRKYIPVLQAYRLQQMFPEQFGDAA